LAKARWSIPGAGVTEALTADPARCLLQLPEHFTLEMRYRLHTRAYQMGFFPGARQTDAFTVQYDTDDYFELLRFFMFAI
jgi:D-amino peptidase